MYLYVCVYSTCSAVWRWVALLYIVNVTRSQKEKEKKEREKRDKKAKGKKDKEKAVFQEIQV